MKGHKECPKCGADNGARATVCVSCNEPFFIGESSEPTFIPVYGNTIYTPAGKCPVPWKGDLHEWIEGVRHTDEQNHFSATALRYWFRTIVDKETYSQLAKDIA